jgi:hypothetical protein
MSQQHLPRQLTQSQTSHTRDPGDSADYGDLDLPFSGLAAASQ